MTAPRSQGLSNLTRRHGVKVASAESVEDCCLAVGEVVGHEHMSASRMNSATVVFLSSVEKANELVETGIVVDNLFTPVLPLSMPSKKVLLSNVPPFVSDETLVRIMSRYGKLVSPIKMIPVSCKSPLLKHVVSFRRFFFMILKEDEELDLSLHLKVDECDYIIYATTEKMKCFNCREVGPSNAAPSGTESGQMKEGVDVSPSTSKSVTAQVADPETVVTKNCSANADTSISKSAVQTDMQSGDGAVNVLQSDSRRDGFEMEAEQSQFKIPTKRKISGDFQATKAKKADVEDVYCDDGMESGGESSDSSVSLSQSDFSTHNYEVDDIKLFLRATKNKRVRVTEFFPDAKQFVDKTRHFMSENLFTNKEIYRLKKIVRKLSSGNTNEDSEKA